MDYKINDAEREGLYGLPYLQQLLYLRGIRPFMDFATGMVGMKRGISYQSLSEELFVEPHPGYRSGKPSRDQVRRAIRNLEKEGVIQLQSQGKKLQIYCVLAERDNCARKKAAIKAPYQAASLREEEGNDKSAGYSFFSSKADRVKKAKAATPPVDNNYFYFLWGNFEIFWNLYPIKKSKQKAWEIFQTLNPSAEAFQIILSGLERQCVFYQDQRAKGHWVPHWKYPANWLTQRCWEDELSETSMSNSFHEDKNYSDEFWESCKGGDYDEESNITNIIQLSDYKNESKSD